MASTTLNQKKKSHAADTIASQHEQLKLLVTNLPETKDLAVLLGRLKELRRGLETHFELEEGMEGFHDIVLERAPRHHTRVQRLFDEHREFLRQVDAITSKIHVCLAGPAAEIFREVEAFTQALHSHEERENEMLWDAMDSDTGFAE
jgi:iron-sulfur cluster repair protein YtfE (RIC family)